MSLKTPRPSASNDNGTDTLVDTSHANGHLNGVANLMQPEPASDESAFALLMAAAESVGRLDLAEEFRKRARESNKPAAPEKPAHTAAERAAATKCAKEGLRLLRLGKVVEAIAKFREAIALDSDQHDAHANLGVAYGRTGKRQEAEECFREAIRVRPQHAPNYGNLCNVCMDQGKLAEAEEAIRKAIELNPKEGDFQRQLGVTLEARGQSPDAETAYRAAVKLKPKDVESHTRLGKVLSKNNRHADAEACFRETTRLQPDKAAHWINLGGCLEAQNQSKDAESVYRVAVGLEPKNPEIHNNLGVALAAQSKWADAEASYRKALELSPELAMAHNNLGNNLRSQERLDEAEECLKEAIRIAPRYAEAHNNLGIVYIQQRRIDEGIACYDEALRLKPDYPEAHLNRSLMRLAAGDFERGWPEYEWRFKMRHRNRPTAPAPEWDGSPLNGRRLLIRAEQGIGDCAQFMRYGKLIPRGTGGTVIMECPEPLIDLAKTCEGIDELTVRGNALPPCDLVIPLLTVGGLLKTTLATIPADIPYISTDPARVEYWQNELSTLPGLRVGISWQGSLDHRGDRMRSVPLTRFAEFAKIPCITLCSLQKNVGSEQLLDANVKDVTIHDFGSLTAPSFADTAALLQSLDLVLTIDTAIGHIAGALGVPVWVIIPAASDWRWLNVREDTPWYPTMRLFRQPKPGDWDPVFTRLTTALLQWPERLRKALAASRGGNK